MASASAPPRDAPNSAQRRISTAAATLFSDYQSLMLEIRKAVGVIRGVAVDLEKQEQSSDMVKQLEDAVVELLQKYGECANYSRATQIVADDYEPPEGDQTTDFEKLLREQSNKINVEHPIVTQSDPLFRQFKEAIWNVHHAGELMPGDENEDIIMTSTQSNFLNMACPLTGKPLTELENPVRCFDCMHIYEKAPILHYIKSTKPHALCPVAGCPKILDATRVQCDPRLAIEIEELRSRGDLRQTRIVEDCTELGDDDGPRFDRGSGF